MATATDINPVKVQEIIKLIELGDYDFYGIRVIHGQAAPAKVGDTLDTSYRWEDGEPTDDELYGTCALAVDCYSNISRSLAALIKGYGSLGDQVVLVGGHQCEWGEDAGEIIIKDAVVLMVSP